VRLDYGSKDYTENERRMSNAVEAMRRAKK
jgi:hypothetical protein